MEIDKYVLKLDGDYYAGQNAKYWDMINLSGSGAIGAKKMNKEEAERLQTAFARNGWVAEIEIYDPKKYLKASLEKILVCNTARNEGKDIGYSIENLVGYCLRYLEQVH